MGLVGLVEGIQQRMDEGTPGVLTTVAAYIALTSSTADPSTDTTDSAHPCWLDNVDGYLYVNES